MMNSILRPLVEGFRGSVALWKEIILALLSVVSVVKAFVNVAQISDFNNAARRSD